MLQTGASSSWEVILTHRDWHSSCLAPVHRSQVSTGTALWKGSIWVAEMSSVASPVRDLSYTFPEPDPRVISTQPSCDLFRCSVPYQSLLFSFATSPTPTDSDSAKAMLIHVQKQFTAG